MKYEFKIIKATIKSVYAIKYLRINLDSHIKRNAQVENIARSLKVPIHMAREPELCLYRTNKGLSS